MSLKVAFDQTDITPPPGTHKIGWLKDIVGDHVIDPIMARIAIFESQGERIAFVQLDTLSIRWTQVNDLRQRIEAKYGFPGAHIMVSATHNHAGPAIATCGEAPRDDAYVETMVTKIVSRFGHALAHLQEASIGFGSCFDFAVGHNRRIIMRDGTTCTHGSFNNPNALCMEGPVDPELAVLVARDKGGAMLGCTINYACHPTDHGPGTGYSAGFPGVLAREMKAQGCPVTLFLNGAAGNICPTDPCAGSAGKDLEEVGRLLAEDALRVIGEVELSSEAKLGANSATIQLPFRTITDDEIKGTVRGAQRFVDPGVYDRTMPQVIERIRHMETQPAEVQALSLDEYSFVSIPAEYFVEHGLRIKEQSHPRHALVVGFANGMVGYVPTAHAFLRGGYETTFTGSSRMAPEAGDMLADCAIGLITSEG